jgi:hypothetical protein
MQLSVILEIFHKTLYILTKHYFLMILPWERMENDWAQGIRIPSSIAANWRPCVCHPEADLCNGPFVAQSSVLGTSAFCAVQTVILDAVCALAL